METFKTAGQIAEEAGKLPGKAALAKVNKLYRQQDESHLWPIKGRFNVTERAIRKAREMDTDGILEYSYLLDNLISEIVNNPRNQ